MSTEKIATSVIPFSSRIRPKKSAGQRVLGETIGLFATALLDSDPLVRELARTQFPRELELIGLFLRVSSTPWEEIGIELRARYLQLALHNSRSFMPLYNSPFCQVRGIRSPADPSVWSWDLNLSREVEARALASPLGPQDYLKRRLDKRLIHPAMTPYWFAVEFSDTGRMHLHGMLACDPELRQEAEQVLYRVAGDLGAHRPFGLRVTPMPSVSDGLGKAAYAIKNVRGTHLRTGHKALVTTHDVIREAKRLHAAHVEAVTSKGASLGLEVRHAA